MMVHPFIAKIAAQEGSGPQVSYSLAWSPLYPAASAWASIASMSSSDRPK
jgi:hypothetical protein